MPRLLQRLDGAIGWVRVQPDVDEEAVVAIHGRLADRLALHRDDALALFASALGDQLLDPVAERRYLRRRDERDLVASLGREAAHHSAEPDAGIVFDRHRIRA